jgi:hypothetical protein
MAVIWEADRTVNDEADVVPNLTDFAVPKPVPVMFTEVPPLVGPLERDREEIAGTGS